MITTRCQNCGTPLASDHAGEVCPRCLLREALGRGPEDDGAGADADMFPRPFGDYELLGELGRGGMGMVFRARQIDLDRIVALKTPVAGAFVDAAARRRFRVEAEAAAHLQHPNIVAIHEVGEVDGQPFFTMDLVDGPDLATLCDGRPLSPRLAAEYLRDIAAAVAAAHAAGVLHRDLKPSNVLVGSDGRPRVTDFGLAKRADLDPSVARTLTGQMIGSPSYAPPEQASGRQKIPGPTCDIYGLGALLYHLATGRAPFVGATATDTLRLVLETEPVAPRLLNPSLPRDLETIGLKCLAKEPARRYASAAEVAEDLECFLANRPIRARPPNVFYRARKFVQRHRTMVAATALIVLALVAGLLLSLAGYRRVVVEQRATDAARHQAENLVGLMTQDLKPALERRGGLPQLLQMTEAAVRYYELLPPELRNTTTERRHADALAALARLRGISLDDRQGAEANLRAALVLREAIARENPDHPEMAAEALWDQWEFPWIVGDTAAQFSVTRHEEFLHRWESLHARFPDNFRVTQGLAEVLAAYAQLAAGNFDKLQEAVAAATDCRTIVEGLVAARPQDKTLGDLVEKSLRALATALHQAGDTAQAMAVCEQALAYCSDGLKADPGNLKLREQTAEAARNLSYRAGNSERGLEAELIAREHYRMLVALNPDDQEYRFRYALTHMMECTYLFAHASNFDAMRRAYREFHALLEPFVERKGYESWSETLAADHLSLAFIEASDGRAAEARREIEQAQRYSADYCRRLPEGSFERRAARVRFLNAEQRSLYWLRDWPELARTARDCLTEVAGGLALQPANGELLLRRAMTNAFLGIAALGEGRSAEAIALLQPAVELMHAAPNGPLVTDQSTNNIQYAQLALAEALAQHGGVEQSRQAAERLLLWMNFNRVIPYPQARWAALALTRAARLFDPAEAPRILAVADLAEKLVTPPVADASLTIGAKEAMAAIPRLRAMAAAHLTPDALEETGREFDAAMAAGDPNVVEQITRAGEAAWNSGPWISAIASPRAREAELTAREGYRTLIAQDPESQGYRFLFAATHRMECYVHFGWDGKVELAREGFRAYDALLEPFVGRNGFESVLRTRLENSLHLAQLAASVGDRAEATRWLEEARRRFEAYRDRLPEGSMECWLARVRFLEASAWSAWWLRDWPDLARLAQEALVECTTLANAPTATEELRARQAMAEGFAALAAVDADPGIGSAALLQGARDHLLSLREAVSGVWDGDAEKWIVDSAWLEALRRRGDLAQAKNLSAELLNLFEPWVPHHPEYWPAQKHLAAVRLQAAGLLDPALPAEAARRKELLDAATVILAPDRVAGRLTVDVQEMLAKLAALRSGGGA